MNRFRVFAISALMMAAVVVTAQQPAPGSESSQAVHNPHVPTAAEQMKLLGPRLELTADQQAKITPMLEELHDATVKVVHDESLTHEEKMKQVHALRIKADGQIREVLTEEQKAKLDQIYHEPHPELHGDVR